jgi:hypothetical protein
VNTKHTAKTRSSRTGIFATLAALLRRKGSGGPSTDRVQGTGMPPGSPIASSANGAASTKDPQAVSGQNSTSTRPELRPSRTAQVKDAGRVAAGAHGSVRDVAARLRTQRWAVLGATFAALLVPAANAASAQAAEPWWNLNTSIRPAVINEGGEATIFVRAANLGNACTPSSGPGPDGKPCTADDEGIVPTTLTATLPSRVSAVEEGGLPAVSIFAYGKKKGVQPIEQELFGHPLEYCHVTGRQVTCQDEPTAAFLNEPPFSEPPTKELVNGLVNVPPIAPYEYFEMRVKVRDEGATPGATFTSEVSGGGAAAVSHTRPLPLGSGSPPFGAEQYELRPEEEGGEADLRAGSHPYQLTATFNLNQNGNESEPGRQEQYGRPPALPRNLAFRLPPGQIADAVAYPRCSSADFGVEAIGGVNLCPADTAIGVALLSINEPLHIGSSTYPVPLFNLEPAFGEPARFAFGLFGTPVILDTAVRSGKAGTKEGDYGVTVSTRNTTQLANFISSTVTFWGTPGDPTHDSSRGWQCLANQDWVTSDHQDPPSEPCQPESQKKPAAFITLPTDCGAPFATTAEGDSWTSLSTPVRRLFGPFEGADPLGLVGCNQVPFAPTVHSEPTSDAATSPTGLSFDINFEDEGLTNSKPGASAQSQMKKAVVTLPEGFTTNPSVAEGLKACSEVEYEAATLEPNSGCTAESKVGEVTVQSPLVEPDQIVKGGIYVARQTENPNHNLLSLYLIVREPEIGVLIKQVLKVVPDPVTGQLTTEVDNVPQLPFSHFHLFFRPGQRAPLVTPPACGPYTVRALMYPWSNQDSPVERTSSFQITSGPEGQGCPSGGVPPFHPVLEAGTLNNVAGTYSPFVTHITRKDSEQEITRFSIKLPPGLSGRLVGVAKCSDAAIAAAKSREHELGGQEEIDHPSCPASSEVGHTLVGTGVGNVLAYAPGKLYLAGPYKGSNLSIVSITAAKVGPFDLGTVVIREGLKVDPTTAQVSVDAAGSDPIPHIVDGIPVHLRDIRIYVDRSNFTINPTSCAKMSTAATVLGSGLNFASESDDQPVTVTSPFQAADCASLGFKPELGLKLLGKTRRGGLPKLVATVTYPKNGAYANIASTIVTLPDSELLEQGHIGTSCTRVQFNAGGGNGEQCPAKSIYGHAKAITPLLEEPVEGPVYLRSNGGERQLPDLVAALHSKDINVNLVGFIDSVHKKGTEKSAIRTRFLSVPDAPVSKFTLEMSGGKKGLLINSTNLCKGNHRAKSQFVGQNGKRYETEPKVQAQCGKGKKKGKGGKKK